ncbi:hypothetical protein PHLGIDRAFT_119226 [Phlebiopsis gigantea 11061_1 CR5-6]|uniref:Secreted protein n=1 Tax=Phlebiopsis gigantea (strain 11061_1 CR5-6) TaxID=745531 RepID=A0A0C3S9D3_PHLG1|nr:hypothetical protein PHLGIDRAFT_119226 [Phlebiopsis gigantea 11061_1 CR5-6]
MFTLCSSLAALSQLVHTGCVGTWLWSGVSAPMLHIHERLVKAFEAFGTVCTQCNVPVCRVRAEEELHDCRLGAPPHREQPRGAASLLGSLVGATVLPSPTGFGRRRDLSMRCSDGLSARDFDER